MQSHFMSRVIIVKILPVDGISEDRFEGNPLMERPIAINEFAPTLIIRRSKTRKIGPSTRTIRVYINEECRSNIPSDSVRIVEPVVVVAVLAGDAIILYHDRHEIAESFVERKGFRAVFDSFYGLVASVQLRCHRQSVCFVDVRFAVVIPHGRWSESAISIQVPVVSYRSVQRLTKQR